MAKQLAEGRINELKDSPSFSVPFPIPLKTEDTMYEIKSPVPECYKIKYETFSDDEELKDINDGNDPLEENCNTKLDDKFIKKFDCVLEKTSNEKKYECDVCESSFTQAFNLQRHKLRKHDGRKIKLYSEETNCLVCDPEKKMPNSRKHYKDYHFVSSLEVHPCPSCSEWLSTEKELERHKQFHGEDPKRLYCNLCPHQCVAKTSIKKTNSLGTTEAKIRKDEKKTTFIATGQASMNAHLEDHEKIHQCADCGLVFPLLKNLKIHISLKHSKEIKLKKTVVCEVCALTVQKRKLMRHMMGHTGEKNKVCNINGCNMRFIDGKGLRAHQRKHTGEKPYKCDMCDSSFKRSDHLAKHTLLHTGERPHVCQYCDKSFIQNCNLKVHQAKCKYIQII